MAGKPTCPVCGGLEYFEAEGFYYCIECQTQSQEIREEVHDYIHLIGGLSTTRIFHQNQKKTSEDNNEWTTWELHNFVLKGLVDELIALGATTKLKTVVLQLWATYLQKIEVAFISKNKSFKLPKLGVVYHERDARLIYGVGCQKRSKIKRKEINTEHEDTSIATQSNATPVSNSQLKKTEYHRSKRALFKYESEKSCDDLDAYSLLNESLKSANSSDIIEVKKLKRSYLSNAARELHSYSSKKSKKSIRNYPENLTRSILVAIVYIALMICQEKIQLSDIIRWIEAGELSYYEITHFLPEAQKLKGKDVLIFGPFHHRISYSGISETAKDLTTFLTITHIPTPDMSLLVTRYIKELQLPVEMTNFVQRLMCLSVQLKESPKKETLWNFEGRAMGFIIVTLKLLLGLDGETEYKMSEVAEKLNKFLDNTSESAKLFVWTDWVKYIECRKSLLAQSHFPTQDSLFQDRVLDPSAYINLWNKTKSKDVNRKDRIILTQARKNDPEILDAMNNVMQRLQNMEGSDSELPEFVPSFTPQKTALETFLTTKPEDFETAISTDSVLKQDFFGTSMNYLIEPESYVVLAQENGMEIAVENNSAQVKVNVVEKVTREIFAGKGKLYEITDEIQSNSEAVLHPSDSSVQAKNILLRCNKRKNVEPGPHSWNKNVRFEFPDSSACISSSKNVDVVSENVHSPNENSGNDSPENSDYADHFKSLHQVTKNILLRHLKQNNIKVNHFLKSKKAKSDSPVPSECAINSSLNARMKRSCSGSRFAEFTDCQTSSVDKEAGYKFPKHSKSSDLFKNLPLVKDTLLKYLNKNDIKVVNIPVVRDNFAFSSSCCSVFDSNKNCEMNSKKDRNQRGPETDTMYMSNSEYWLYDKNTMRLNSEDFDIRVMTFFPPSFQWLLKECARVLHMSVQELYAEVLNVEHTLLMYGNDLSNKDKKMKRNRK